MKIIFNIKIQKRLVFSMAFFFTGFIAAGQTYFQQQVNYDLKVRLDDVNHTVSGFEQIQYFNNAPEPLSFIYFHLWPNAYRDKNSALAKQLLLLNKTELFFSKKEQRGFIDSLDFKVNGKKITWEFDPHHSDICKLILNEPLKPNDSILITTPFFVKIPDARFSRLGHNGQAYFITQWYPKPAVFDNKGWHPMPYLDQGEFYSEFGNFDVSITLPGNYLLSATGNRIDAAEEEQFLAGRVEETRQYINSDTRNEEGMFFPPSFKDLKTIRFRQENAHDFAWFADKRFYVLHDSVKIPGSNKRVETWIYFTDKNFEIWKKALQYVKDATLFYSRLIGDYPYSHVTAIEGTIMAGSGMEYPCITVIGDADTGLDLDIVITHEIGHNWFYGALANNERDEPFMDEGINSFYELRYTRIKYPFTRLTHVLGQDSTFRFLGLNKTPYWKYNELAYLFAARDHSDQPLNLNSESYTEKNYGSMIYCKSALALDYLFDQLGEQTFDSLMRVYYFNYRFRHPSYADFLKNIRNFNPVLADQFHAGLISTDKDIDLKIKNSRRNSDSTYIIRVKNKTGINLPFSITGYKNGIPVVTKRLDGINRSGKLIFTAKEIDVFKIDGENKMPDVYRKNNMMRTKGVFRKIKPLSFKFITALENAEKTQVNYLPALGANVYNGMMAGVLLHNYSVYEKRSEAAFAPMYAFRSRTFAGAGYLDRKFYPGKVFSKIILGVRGKTFGYDIYHTEYINTLNNTDFKDVNLNYYRIVPFIELELKKNMATSLLDQKISYASTQLFTDSLVWSQPDLLISGPGKKNIHSFVNVLNYEVVNNRVIDPYKLFFRLQHTLSMAKASITYHHKITVAPAKNIELRFFAGGFITGSPSERGYYAFRASGYQGSADYLFDHYFIGRNESQGLGYNQFAEEDGALKIRTPLGQTGEWLLAMNIKSPRFFKLPLRVFADLAFADGRSLNNEKYIWDAGINLTLWKEIIEVYVPLLYNDDVRRVMALNGTTFAETIRFTLNIHKLGPKYLIRNSLF